MLLAFLSAVAALGAISRHNAPAVAAAFWPANGPVLTTMADRSTRSGITFSEPLTASVDENFADVARLALSVEPSSAAALRTLALYHQSKGRRQLARTLMQRAAAITKRDQLVNYWLIDDYGRAGDVDAALAAYDQTLRVIAENQAPVLTMMAATLVNPEVVAPLYRLLRTRPPWADSFWHVAAQMPTALENAGRLRILLARDGVAVAREKDAMLLNAMAEHRLFDLGRAVYAAVSDLPRHRRAGLVIDGEFSNESTLPPYEWRLTSSGDLGASINPQAGVLEISALPGARGEAARQVVRLAPGRYRVQGDYRIDGSGSVRIELVCAELGAPASLRRDLALSPGRSTAMVDLSTGRCRHYWLILNIAADEDSNGVDIAFDRLQLSPA